MHRRGRLARARLKYAATLEEGKERNLVKGAKKDLRRKDLLKGAKERQNLLKGANETKTNLLKGAPPLALCFLHHHPGASGHEYCEQSFQHVHIF